MYFFLDIPHILPHKNKNRLPHCFFLLTMRCCAKLRGKCKNIQVNTILCNIGHNVTKSFDLLLIFG